MARITRKTQKTFGVSAGATGITEYGTPAAGSAVYSTDPDDIQTTEWETGWAAAALAGTEIPTFQDFNAIHYVATRQIGYLLQEGVPEYGAGTEYHEFSVVKKSGTYELYGSKTDANTGNALPSQTDNTDWQYLGSLAELVNVGGDLPVGTIYMNTSDSTNPATLLGYGTWVAIQDRMIIGASGTYAAGSTGGSATTTQTTTTLAAHTHGINRATANTGTGAMAGSAPVGVFDTTTSTGSGSAMTTISPYYAAYTWRRTA